MYACDSDQRQYFLHHQQSSGDTRFSGSRPPSISRPQPPLDHGHSSAGPSSGAYWNYSTSQTPLPLTSREYIAVSMITVTVGLVAGEYGNSRSIPMIARVTLIDSRSSVLLDTYVQPTHRITDYRAESTGLSYLHLQGAPSFEAVQRATAKLLLGNIIVGHRLWDFLTVMGLSHPAIDTRDLALYRPLRKRVKARCVVDLRTLVRWFVGREIGTGWEDSLENALAALELFRVIHAQFEASVASGRWPCDLPPVSCARHFL